MLGARGRQKERRLKRLKSEETDMTNITQDRYDCSYTSTSTFTSTCISTIYSQIHGAASLAGCFVLPLDMTVLFWRVEYVLIDFVCFGRDASVVIYMMRSISIMSFQQLLHWASKRLAFCKKSCRVNALPGRMLFPLLAIKLFA